MADEFMDKPQRKRPTEREKQRERGRASESEERDEFMTCLIRNFRVKTDVVVVLLCGL